MRLTVTGHSYHYEATGDPRTDADVRVTRVRVMDPLYPHGSRWGPSPRPDSLVGRKALARPA